MFAPLFNPLGPMAIDAVPRVPRLVQGAFGRGARPGPGADVSADEKWFTRLVVAAVVVHALQRLGAHCATAARTGT